MSLKKIYTDDISYVFAFDKGFKDLYDDFQYKLDTVDNLQTITFAVYIYNNFTPFTVTIFDD